MSYLALAKQAASRGPLAVNTTPAEPTQPAMNREWVMSWCLVCDEVWLDAPPDWVAHGQKAKHQQALAERRRP